MKKKRPMLFFLAALSCLSMMAIPAAAIEIPETQDNTIITPQAEETEWAYRKLDGKYQKRLWSITYGYWLTDWIDCVV
jgi:hypothetical protein